MLAEELGLDGPEVPTLLSVGVKGVAPLGVWVPLSGEDPGLDDTEVSALLSEGVEGVESVGPGEVAGLS